MRELGVVLRNTINSLSMGSGMGTNINKVVRAGHVLPQQKTICNGKYINSSE